MEKIIKIIKLFWPKFHNRIAWTVVIAGLALISSPLWEQLISALLSKQFALTSYIPNEPASGITLVALGLCYHLGANIIELLSSRTHNAKQHDAEQHDKALAKQFLEKFTEDEVLYQLEVLGGDHSSDDEQWKILSGIERFGNLTENEFIDPKVQESFRVLHSDINYLASYICEHFFPMNNSSRTYLYPHFNVDRKGTGSAEESSKYHSFANPLVQRVILTQENYRAFRRTLKTRLAI